MKVDYTKGFLRKLSKQGKYIAKDKPMAAAKFERDILLKTLIIPDAPFSYRKSDFFDDENVREMIFKGYRIIFRIKKSEIQVFGFYKWEGKLRF